MGYSVRTSEFIQMSDDQRAEAVTRLVGAALAKGDGKTKPLNAKLDEFEHKHGLSSSELLEKLSSGELKETDEISEWLWLLNLGGRSRLSQSV